MGDDKMLEKLLNQLEIAERKERKALDKLDVSSALEETLKIRQIQAKIITLLLRKESRIDNVH